MNVKRKAQNHHLVDKSCVLNLLLNSILNHLMFVSFVPFATSPSISVRVTVDVFILKTLTGRARVELLTV